jgi:hypothetical protein
LMIYAVSLGAAGVSGIGPTLGECGIAASRVGSEPRAYAPQKTAAQVEYLFDHPVGKREQLVGNGQAERLRGLEVDDQLELGRLVDRQICRLLALENPRGMDAGAAIAVREAISIAHEAACPGHLAIDIDGRNCVSCSESRDLFAPTGQE